MGIKQIIDAGNGVKAQAKVILDRAQFEGRAPNTTEKAELDRLLAKLGNLKTELQFAQILGELGAEPLGAGVRFDAALKSAGWHFRNAPSVQMKASDVTLPSVGSGDVDGLATPVPGIVQMGADRRFLYPVFRTKPATELGIRTLRQAAPAALGSGDDIERDPLSDSEKAHMVVEFEAVTEEMSQVAAVAGSIPNAALEYLEGLPEAVRNQLSYQLDLGVDTHVVSQVAAASPPGGSSGDTIVEQIRNGIEAMRAVGRNPTVVAMNGTDAADLATLKAAGGSEEYIFPIESANQPNVFGLTIKETPAAADPILVDPSLNTLYLGPARFDSDPYSEFTKNLTTLRAEALVLFSVTSPDAFYQITAGSGS